MKKRNVNKLISLWLIAALSLALANSTARAENVAGVAHRTVTIDNVDNCRTVQARPGGPRAPTGYFASETHGQEIADLMRDFLNRKLKTPTAAN